jgi:hypothetical protein
MKRREYYSVRIKKNLSGLRLDLATLLKLFYSLYKDFEEKGYFQESFGYSCVDHDGHVAGTLGFNIGAMVLRKLRKDNLWTIDARWGQYSEEDLFDVIEFLFDYISKPIDGYYHDFNDCGMHYSKFEKQSGQNEYRNEINELLKDYGDGYEISSDGEILSLADNGLQFLLEANLPRLDPDNVEKKIEAAILKFRRYRSSLDERKEAVRTLADVLEFLRPQLKEVLSSKDESDLFNIANNFAIRHHNPSQKTEYDQPIWLSWIFYFYLSTIHAGMRLIQKKAESKS